MVGKRTNPSSSWDDGDEEVLIQFLQGSLAMAGDGMNFKQATWNAAAEHMVPFTTQGGTKTANACKNKFSRLRELYHVVIALKEQSGFKWDEEKGADIKLESESVWAAYIKAHPKASSFRSKGWPHLESMRSLMPTTAKGANVFRASQGDCVRAISPEVEDDKASEHDSEEVPSQQSAIPWSPSPSPKACSPALPNNQHTPSPLVFAPTPPNGKRKHSALSAVTPATTSLRSTPSTSSRYTKRARTEITGPAALQGLTAELSAFGQTLLEGASLSAPPVPLLAPSPSRKTKAILRAQELEDGLDDGRLAALIRVFQADVCAADAYLVLQKEGVRKEWILSTLASASGGIL